MKESENPSPCPGSATCGLEQVTSPLCGPGVSLFKKMGLEVPAFQSYSGGMRDVIMGHVVASLGECRHICPCCTVGFLLGAQSSACLD